MPIPQEKPMTESQKFLREVSNSPEHSDKLFGWISKTLGQMKAVAIALAVLAAIMGCIIGVNL